MRKKLTKRLRKKLQNELKRNSKEYEKNIELLIKAVGDKDIKAQKKYLIIENNLENRCEELQKQLGVYINDICPMVDMAKSCGSCSGVFIKENFKNKYISRVNELGFNAKYYRCRLHKESLKENAKDHILLVKDY